MKMVDVISLFLVVLGGLHFALTGLGVNMLGAMFGGANLTILYIAMGVSTLYHVGPMFTAKLSAL
jgi:uncharacterized membrane protein YuzA (DUF378 family)